MRKIAGPLSEYFEAAMGRSEYEQLEDGTYGGRVPGCPGVIAFQATLRECERELRSTLEDWVLTGLKLGHALPIVGGIDLNLNSDAAPAEGNRPA